MKNKGFTLIELIGTIVIISLIALIIIPAISNTLKEGIKDAEEQTEKSIVLAAKNYFSDNPKETCVELKTLQEQGYIDYKIKSPIDNTEITYKKVTITKTNGKKEYEYRDGTCN